MVLCSFCNLETEVEAYSSPDATPHGYCNANLTTLCHFFWNNDVIHRWQITRAEAPYRLYPVAGAKS